MLIASIKTEKKEAISTVTPRNKITKFLPNDDQKSKKEIKKVIQLPITAKIHIKIKNVFGIPKKVIGLSVSVVSFSCQLLCFNYFILLLILLIFLFKCYFAETKK